jgi:signal transduction histidine kinase
MAHAQPRSFTRLTAEGIRHDRGLRVLTAAVMVLFVLVVYVIIVIGGGAVLGRSSPSLWLSVLATAIVAIAFEPVRRGVERTLARALHQERSTPYQVLARFPSTVSGEYPIEQLPMRMARVLAEGTGAAGAEVWLMVHGRLELAASWPPAPSDSAPAPDRTASDAAPGAATTVGAADQAPNLVLERPGERPVVVVDGLRRSLAVRERGELLGALSVVVRDGQELTPIEERLFAGLAAQSGLMLRVAGLRAELEQQLASLERRSMQLRKARRDLLSRQDAERQRLERNIHDGAQQEVIALLVNLRLAQTLLTRSPERAGRLLAEQAAAARATIETLDELSRGLYPRLLADAGPVTALRAAVANGPIPVDVTALSVPRCSPQMEAAVYFCCLEAVQNATKHSGAGTISIEIVGHDADLPTARVELTVADDGRGFDVDRPSGGGLANIRDRIESVGGVIAVESQPGHGTTIRARIPVAANTLVDPDPSPTSAHFPNETLMDAAQFAAAPATGR